jgi:hypothetical protein
MDKPTINEYRCDTCGKVIVTVDRADGTTPLWVACRVTPSCAGLMRSAMYQCDQAQTPTHEWYRPKKIKGTPDEKRHLQMGGLLIRPIKKTEGDEDCYIGRRSCGCVVAALVIDTARGQKETGKIIGQWVSEGLMIERVTTEYVRQHFTFTCPHRGLDQPHLP